MSLVIATICRSERKILKFLETQGLCDWKLLECEIISYLYCSWEAQNMTKNNQHICVDKDFF